MNRASYVRRNSAARRSKGRLQRILAAPGRRRRVGSSGRPNPDTLLAHRLILFADEQGQARPDPRLFRALFADGGDVGRPEELAEIAAEAGLGPRRGRRFLAAIA